MSAQAKANDESAALWECFERYQRLRQELAKVVVGQDEVVEQVMVAILARGHVLVEGVPGLAKSLLLASLAEAAGLHFKRIQFTADLAPADVIGAEVTEPDPASGDRCRRFVPGPLFANLILADEVDQAPVRTQSTLLDAMQDRQVTVNGRVQQLPDPFFVLATHNLQEERELRLRQAQLDRFLLMTHIDYPSGSEEWEIARRAGSLSADRLQAQLSSEDIGRFQQAIGRVTMSERVLGYAWTLVRATRPTAPEAPDFVDRWITWGAGPRGLLALVSCAKARAVLHGRGSVAATDVETLALPALRHRIVANSAAEANALTNDRLLRMIMESIPPDGDYQPPPGVAESH
jgi:MoxR-like ATPase